jgi:hypothetical protein
MTAFRCADGVRRGERRNDASLIRRAETNSPSILWRRGWTPDSLRVGDKVTNAGWPARWVIGQPLG